MPIDKPEATATDNPRRTFLARAVMGGALVTAGTVAGPLLRAVPAGAQAPSDDALDDSAFAAIATPIELAAVQVYAAALLVDGLSSEVVTDLRLFQRHHQTVADTTRGLYTGDAPIAADPTILASAASVGTDQASVLASLATLEETLAATHLSAMGSLTDATTAKVAAQVLAVEGQHAVALTVLAEGDLAAVTPATVSPDGVAAPAATDGDTTTTSEEAGN